MTDTITWPTAQDIIDELAGAGITASEGRTLSRALRTAIEAFEAATGYTPFFVLADAQPSERVLSCSDGEWLDLKAGAVEITSVKAGDTELTAGTGGFNGLSSWYPGSREPDGPITYIRLRYPLCGNWREVTVTARWGYCTSLPALVESAIIAKACAGLAEKLTQTEDGRQLEEVQEGDVKKRWSTSVTERRAIFERWDADWKRAVARYRLPGGIA